MEVILKSLKMLENKMRSRVFMQKKKKKNLVKVRSTTPPDMV